MTADLPYHDINEQSLCLNCLNNMASKNDKSYAPPTFHSGDEFDNWLREIELWQCITDLDIKKQGPAIYLSLEGQA